MEANYRQATTVFTVQPSFHHRPLDKPSIMKRYHRRWTCSHTSPRRSPTIVTCHDTGFVECRWWNEGWTVKTVVTWRSSASMIPDPRLRFRLCLGSFSRSSHTSGLKIGDPVATLPGARSHRASAGTGWPGASMLLSGWDKKCDQQLLFHISPWDTIACCLYVKQSVNDEQQQQHNSTNQQQQQKLLTTILQASKDPARQQQDEPSEDHLVPRV